MPIVKNLGLVVNDAVGAGVGFYLPSSLPSQDLTLLQDSAKTFDGYALQFPVGLPFNVSFQQFKPKDEDLALLIQESISNYYLELLSSDHSAANSVKLISQEAVMSLTNLAAYEKFFKVSEFVNLLIAEKVLTVYGHTYVHSLSVLEDLIGLFQVDIAGPRLYNVSPLEYSYFNNPYGDVSFKLQDQEHTSIREDSINFSIDGIEIITHGVDVTPSGFGVTTFTRQNDWTYDFVFTPSVALGVSGVVVVSGSATDTYVPPNHSEFNYYFSVHKEESLFAQISGVPDSFPPYLVDASPYPFQIEVVPDSTVAFSVVDDHTGINFNSLEVSLGGRLVLSGGINVDSLYASVTTFVSPQRVDVVIEPSNKFNFNEQVNVEIRVEDNYTFSPNVFNYSYLFTTIQNQFLVASGFEIYSEGSWLPFNQTSSYYIAESGVDFKIKYINLTGSGVDMISSYVASNEVLVSGSFIEITPGFDYELYFNIVADYTRDCELQFHVTQSGSVSGSEVYRDFYSELLWGAEMCYDPVANLVYDKQYPIVIQGYDLGDWQSINSLVYSFNTTPMPSNRLGGQIIGIAYDMQDLYSNIESHNPFFEYGKEMHLRIEAQDYAGNKLDYSWVFCIEER